MEYICTLQRYAALQLSVQKQIGSRSCFKFRATRLIIPSPVLKAKPCALVVNGDSVLLLSNEGCTNNGIALKYTVKTLVEIAHKLCCQGCASASPLDYARLAAVRQQVDEFAVDMCLWSSEKLDWMSRYDGWMAKHPSGPMTCVPLNEGHAEKVMHETAPPPFTCRMTGAHAAPL